MIVCTRSIRHFLASGIVLGLLLLASVALAEALVVVTVRGPDQAPDGEVTLTPRTSGHSYSCRTESGTCRIDGVPGGQYTVRFTPPGGQPTAPRVVMIPPAGTVRLNVAAR
jgi:hypothetical protein